MVSFRSSDRKRWRKADKPSVATTKERAPRKASGKSFQVTHKPSRRSFPTEDTQPIGHYVAWESSWNAVQAALAVEPNTSEDLNLQAGLNHFWLTLHSMYLSSSVSEWEQCYHQQRYPILNSETSLYAKFPSPPRKLDPLVDSTRQEYCTSIALLKNPLSTDVSSGLEAQSLYDITKGFARRSWHTYKLQRSSDLQSPSKTRPKLSSETVRFTKICKRETKSIQKSHSEASTKYPSLSEPQVNEDVPTTNSLSDSVRVDFWSRRRLSEWKQQRGRKKDWKSCKALKVSRRSE